MRFELIELRDDEVVVTPNVFDSFEELELFVKKPVEVLHNIIKFFKETENVVPKAFKVEGFELEPFSIFELKDIHVGKLIRVKAIVVNISQRDLIPIQAIVRCPNCDEFETVISLDPLFTQKSIPEKVCVVVPTIEKELKCCCSLKEVIYDTENSIFVSRITGTIQDTPDSVPEGHSPGEITFEATGSLTKEIDVGGTYYFTGVILPVKKGRRIIPLFKVLNVEKVDEENVECPDELFERAKKDPYHLWKMVLSFSDKIWGWFNEKLALLLSAVNGSLDNRRSNIHTLLVGDPGVGKSELMRELSKFVKTIVVSGKGASGVGLTASVVRDEDGTFRVVAGALPLASGGVCVIDEIDKLDPKDRQAIHTAMEQGIVEIAKAGKIMKFRANTSVVAGGNPKTSRYDPSKPLIENVKIDEALLSRFDFIFVMRQFMKPFEDSDPRLFDELVLRTIVRNKFPVPYSVEEMRCFIKRAKSLKPSFTKEALKMIFNYAKLLREEALEIEEKGIVTPLPITFRDVEAIQRIASGIAKLKLKDKVEPEDVELALSLYEYMMKTVGFDPLTGDIDSAVLQGKEPVLYEKVLEEVIEYVNKEEIVDVNELYDYLVKKLPFLKKKNVDEFKTFLYDNEEKLADKGIIIEGDVLKKL